jgi:hypothetical protein
VSRTPLFFTHPQVAPQPGLRAVECSPIPVDETKLRSPICPAGCPALPQTSYWLGGSNEMGWVNRFLIIVNTGTVNAFRNQQFSKALWYF